MGRWAEFLRGEKSSIKLQSTSVFNNIITKWFKLHYKEGTDKNNQFLTSEI